MSFLEASAQEKTMRVIWAYLELARMSLKVILLEKRFFLKELKMLGIYSACTRAWTFIAYNSIFNISSKKKFLLVLCYCRKCRKGLGLVVGQIGLIDLIGKLSTPIVSVHDTIIFVFWNFNLHHYCYKNDSNIQLNFKWWQVILSSWLRIPSLS